MAEPTDEEKRKKKISFGPARLECEEEQGHYGLYRPLYVDAWDDKNGEFIRIEADKPVGPLAVFREASGNETVHMKTFHPIHKKPVNLTCVWDPSHTFLRGREQ